MKERTLLFRLGFVNSSNCVAAILRQSLALFGCMCFAGILTAQLTVTINYDIPDCNGYNGGTATANASGGTEPYTYQWNSGQNWQTIGNVQSGFLSVTVTDAASKTVSTGVNIILAPPLEIEVIGGDYNCWSNNNSLTAVATGGQTPLSFAWSTGVQGKTLSNLTETDYYFVTVTDANGCVEVAGTAYTAPMQLSINSIDGGCFGACDGSIQANIQGGMAPYTFAWNNGFTPHKALQAPAPLGSYIVTVTDAFGCSKVGNGYVGEPDPIEITVDLETPCANGTMAHAQVVGGTPPYNITWNNGSTGDNSFLGNGTWHINVLDANQCTGHLEVVIAPGSDLNIAAVATQADCSDLNSGTATANVIDSPVGMAYTFEWSNGQTTKTANGLEPGTYTVTVTNTGGCTGETSVTVEPPEEIVLTSTFTSPDCDTPNGTATITPAGGSGQFLYKWDDPLNQGGQTAYQLSPGTYTVTVTDQNGCTQVMPVEIPDNSIELMVNVSNSSCEDNPTGSAQAQIMSGGTGPFTYKWNDGSTNTSLSNIGGGWYAVTVTDATGCTKAMTVEVEDDAMELAIEVMNQGCPGTSEGALHAVIQGGGLAPYTFEWSNGTQSEAIGTLPEGYYTVTVTDATGCEKETGLQLNTTPPIEMALNRSNSTCEEAANGTAEAAVTTGGAAPFTYKWSNGMATPSVANLAAGTYTVTITDANGCEKMNTIDIENEIFALEVNASDANCDNTEDGGAVIDITNGGTAPFTYNWSNGATDEIAANLAPGSYTVEVTDANGCKETADFAVESGSSIEASFEWEIVDCSEDGIVVQFNDMSGQNGNPAVTWNWNLSTTQSSNQQNPQFLIPDNNVTAELTVTNPDGCHKTVTQEFPLQNIVYEIASEQSVCQGGQFEMNLTVDASSGNITYDWSPDNMILSGDGTPNPVINTSEMGQFALTVSMESEYGCVRTEEIQLNVEDALTFNPASFTYDQCNNLMVDFAVDGAPVGYTWFFDYPNNPTATSMEANPSYEYPAAGTYQVAIVPTEDCAETLYFEVEVEQGAVADFSFETTDCADPVVVEFTDLSNVPSGIDSWHWNFGALGTSDEQNPTLTLDENQTLNAELTITFAGGCSISLEQALDVHIFNPPVLQDGMFSCANVNGVELNPNGVPYYNYQWSPSIGLSDPTAPNPTATVSTTTTYSVIISDPNGCQSTQQTTIEMPSVALALSPLENVISCDFEQIELVAEANMPVDVIWSLNEDFSTIYSTEPVLTITPGATEVTFYLQATNADGCTANQAVIVANLSTGLNFDQAFEVCKGSELKLDLPNVNPVTDFINWSPFNPFTTPLQESTVFTFEFSNEFGCTGASSFSVVVNEFDAEELEITMTDPEGIYPGETTLLEVLNEGNYTYFWTPSSTLSANDIPNPAASPLETTTYFVQVTDEHTGCRSTEEVTVKVLESICEEPYIYIPNAFTPNDDGTNDVLFVRGENIDEVYLTIYDRWGEKMFETNSLDKGWDGKFNGTRVSGDVYGYYVKIICYGGREFFKKGNITVIR